MRKSGSGAGGPEKPENKHIAECVRLRIQVLEEDIEGFKEDLKNTKKSMLQVQNGQWARQNPVEGEKALKKIRKKIKAEELNIANNEKEISELKGGKEPKFVKIRIRGFAAIAKGLVAEPRCDRKRDLCNNEVLHVLPGINEEYQKLKNQFISVDAFVIAEKKYKTGELISRKIFVYGCMKEVDKKGSSLKSINILRQANNIIQSPEVNFRKPGSRLKKQIEEAGGAVELK